MIEPRRGCCIHREALILSNLAAWRKGLPVCWFAGLLVCLWQQSQVFKYCREMLGWMCCMTMCGSTIGPDAWSDTFLASHDTASGRLSRPCRPCWIQLRGGSICCSWNGPFFKSLDSPLSPVGSFGGWALRRWGCTIQPRAAHNESIDIMGIWGEIFFPENCGHQECGFEFVHMLLKTRSGFCHFVF